MTIKAAFTAHEWNELAAAVVASAMYVMAADPANIVGRFQEMLATSKFLLESKEDAGPDSLVGGLLAELASEQDGEGWRASLPSRAEGAHAPAARPEMLARIGAAARLAESKAPPDAQEYKRLLLDVAQQAAEAARAGGFLGIGGERVSAREAAALAELAAVLGLPQQAPTNQASSRKG